MKFACIIPFLLVGFVWSDESTWIKNLASDDDSVRAAAVSNLVASAAPKVERSLLLRFRRVEDPVKVEYLRVLTARKSDQVLQIASDLAFDGGSLAARTEAVRTLGALGGANELPVLAQVAVSSGEKLREISRAAILGLQGDDVNRMIAAGLEQAPTDAMRHELVLAAGARKATEAVPGLLRLANSAGSVAPGTRQKCLESVTGLATLDHLEPLMVIYASEADEDARAAAAGAVRSVILADPKKGETAVLDAHGRSSGQARAGLLRLLSELGGKAPLTRVRADLQHEQGEIQAAAWSSLFRWPDASPAVEVLAFLDASKTETETQQAIYDTAFAAYLRMIPLAPDGKRKGMWEAAEKRANTDSLKAQLAEAKK